MPRPTLTVLLGDPTLPDPTKREGAFHEEDFEARDRMQAALATLDAYTLRFLDRHEGLAEALLAEPPGLVLNFCDTGFRNRPQQELHVAALLEMLGVPYSGAGPACMAVCYDKGLVRALAAQHGIPVPEERYFESAEAAREVVTRFPALLKPNQGDGSVGITQDAVVHDAAEAAGYLGFLAETLPGRAVLVQEYLPGPEYSVGLVGNPETGFTVLPPVQVDFSALPAGLAPILSFESKAVPDSPYWTDVRYVPAVLEAGLANQLAGHAKLLFHRLNLRDYGRFDFRTDADGVVKLLEVNPNPAWGYDGKLALMAGFAGLHYPDLLRMLVEAARARLRHA